MFKALLYAYVLGGITFIPLVVALAIFITVYTSVPVGEVDMAKKRRAQLEASGSAGGKVPEVEEHAPELETNDLPSTRKGWLTMRRTFEECANDTGYVTLVRSFLDARSKDPKRSRPKDMWYVVLKRNILYLYEDEEMTECEGAIELTGHEVLIYPEGLLDGELFAKRNAICLKRKLPPTDNSLPSLTKEMKLQNEDVDSKSEKSSIAGKKKEKGSENENEKEKDNQAETEKKDAAREEAYDPTTPWFIFVRSNIEMEDWYFSLLHASTNPAQTPTLLPLREVFDPADMNHLVATLDDQPDVIPMRWLNALLGRIFFSHYRTHNLEAYIIGRLMKKLSKVKRPAFLTDIVVTDVSVGNKAPMLSKPMLKELTKEGDASLEVHFQYKGEIRITVEATAVINLGARFKSYTVKLVLAAVLKELEGNLLVKVKRPPSNRIWYAFTQTPRMVLEVEPIVSDRQITWGMILSTIESKFKEIIQESVVMPNMDDIAFFDSLPYQNRGGIWADASRHARTSPFSFPETTDDSNPTASALVYDASGTVISEPPAVHVSQSEEILPSQLSETRAKSIDDDSTESARNNARRRTWFSSVRSDDAGGLPLPDSLVDLKDANSADSRGRSYENEQRMPQEKGLAPRSGSGPRSVHSVNSETSTKSEQATSRSQTHLSTRSSSRQSTSYHSDRGGGGGEDRETDDEPSDARLVKSTPGTPRRVSDASQTKRSPSPPSFFSTLKSKAGDKQAISNTAKEAMRKWGVNWGLKKDSNNAPLSNDESQDAALASSSRSNADSTTSPTHKPRASYAEVRAAVAERKERERTAEREDHRPSSPPSTPDRSKTASKAADGYLSTLPNGSVYSENAINPSIVTSAARLTTPRLTSKKSSPSISRVNTDVDTQELTAPDTPIHVQPQAKTMSIPGIHASHRGQVQSMGYVAPQPPAPSTLESKLKNPAMQTVYRLWKSPNATSQDQQETSSNPGQTQHAEQTGVQDGESDKDVTNSTSSAPNSHLAPLLQAAERPKPPPLPPRSVPVLISKSTGATGGVVPDASPSSQASEALRNIATKDENTRNTGFQEHPEPEVEADPMTIDSDSVKVLQSEASIDTSTKSTETVTLSNKTPPALPPRRIQTVA